MAIKVTGKNKKGLKSQAGRGVTDFPGNAYSKPHPKRNPMKWRMEKRSGGAKSAKPERFDTETGDLLSSDGGKLKNTRTF
tara:strand:+ start:43 stop:282 length:240 start_codon:yes stop_codon:yes gene_type:complete